jgi:hypothetical protein
VGVRCETATRKVTGPLIEQRPEQVITAVIPLRVPEIMCKAHVPFFFFPAHGLYSRRRRAHGDESCGRSPRRCADGSSRVGEIQVSCLCFPLLLSQVATQRPLTRARSRGRVKACDSSRRSSVAASHTVLTYVRLFTLTADTFPAAQGGMRDGKR